VADVDMRLRLRAVGREVVRMSTRCQIEFRRGSRRRTVYRHWDGYPSAVVPDLLAFLAWSTRSGDIEYETANFLFWSKRDLDERSVQLGFGVCAPGELHGDVEYYYVVEHDRAGTTIVAYRIESTEHGPRVGEIVRRVAVPQPLSSLILLSNRSNALARDSRCSTTRRCESCSPSLPVKDLKRFGGKQRNNSRGMLTLHRNSFILPHPEEWTKIHSSVIPL